MLKAKRTPARELKRKHGYLTKPFVSQAVIITSKKIVIENVEMLLVAAIVWNKKFFYPTLIIPTNSMYPLLWDDSSFMIMKHQTS